MAQERRIPKFRRRAEARPDEVLDAALALFTEKGFAATRVDDIAKHAGLSKGAVYLYFPSKEALLEGLVKRAIVPVADDALSQMRNFDGDPRILISMFMRMLAQRFADPGFVAIPQIVLREAAVVPSIAEMYRKHLLDRAIPAVTALIQRGIDNGYLRPVNPELTVRSLMGPPMLHLMLGEIFGIRPKGGPNFEALIENHIDILMNGLSPREGEAHE